MAGDWIKLQKDTPDKPEVLAIAARLQIDQDAVVGKLIRIWSWFDTHTIDGNASCVTFALLDRLSAVTGFAEQMALVGWLEQSGHDLKLTNFGYHNGETAKTRALGKNRTDKARSNANSNAISNAPSVTKSLPEKRREEKINTYVNQAEAVIDLYHEILPNLPKVRLHTKDRVKAIRKVWDWVLTSLKPDHSRRAETPEQAVEWFRSYFERATENDFLMGRTPRAGAHADWQCDIDFLLTDRGMKQVIEKTKESA